VLRYVEGNAVRAGLTSTARDWVWSSHQEALGARANGFIDEIPIPLPDEWGRYVDEPLTEKELARLRESAHRQAPFGASIWKSKLCKEFGLESTMRKRGRPIKQREE
jgi:putative transposase